MAAVDITCPHCNRPQKVAEHRLKETVHCLLCQQLITDVYLYKIAPKEQELTIKLKGRIVSEFGTTKLEDLKSRSDEYTGKFEPVTDDSDEVEQQDETTRIFDTSTYQPPTRKRLSTAARTYLIGGLIVAVLTAGVTTLGVVMLSDKEKTGEIETVSRDGTRTERYPNGSKKAEWHVKTIGGVEVNEGEWREWHEDGADKAFGFYAAGERVGKWQGWHANGRPEFEHFYVNGKESSQWMEWHADGKPAMEGAWVEGAKHGKWRTWYKSGSYATLEDYDHGRPVGNWATWYDGDILKSSVEYKEGLRDGKATTYHDNGKEEQLETWKMGLLDGPSRGQYRNQQPSFEGLWVAGGREGEWKWWHVNGKPKRQAEYEGGLENGLWQEWHSNGVVSGKGAFDKGRRVGMWEEFDEDGNLTCRRMHDDGAETSVTWLFRGTEVQRHTETFPDGSLRTEWTELTGADGRKIRHGHERTYYSNGSLAESGTWVNGKRDGQWRTYDSSGNQLTNDTWKEGAKVE